MAKQMSLKGYGLALFEFESVFASSISDILNFGWQD